MARKERTYRWLFGAVLAVATFFTRWPIRSRTLFEFDSIGFAIGAHRFDLDEVTPQMPGYILHVLLGRFLNSLGIEINQAFVLLSVLLSIGSVLFLWRAAAQFRGERVAVIAPLIWLTTPLFWFHGAINAIYIEEAFYTSILLYLGLRWLNRGGRNWTIIAYFAVLSLATGTRETSFLFFLPATVYLLLNKKPTQKTLWFGIAAFVIITGLWAAELLRESGGLSTYLYFARVENNFKTQSMLFGHGWHSQIGLIGKVLFYFVVALGGIWFIVLLSVVYLRRSIQFISDHIRNSKAIFVVLIAAVPLAFYLVIFFMKAGYLLNVLPSAILISAVLIDQCAIWLAEWEKRRSSYPLKLTRPIITRNVALLSGIIVIVNVAWFVIPWPGTEQSQYNNENTRNSFIHGAMDRYEHSGERNHTLANRALEYTNVSGIRAVDSLNNMTLRALTENGAADSGTVIIASWWYRWCYALLPQAVTYDIELDPVRQGALWVGRSHEFWRANLYDSTIRFHSSRPVLLLLRHDRPDFDSLQKQLHLERLPLPEYLDIYRIRDTTFTLKWRDRMFIAE